MYFFVSIYLIQYSRRRVKSFMDHFTDKHGDRAYQVRHMIRAMMCVLVVAFGSIRVVTCWWQLGQTTLQGSGPTGVDILLAVLQRNKHEALITLLLIGETTLKTSRAVGA